MKNAKKRDLIFIISLILILIGVIVGGTYKDKKFMENDQKKIQAINLNKEEEIKKNTQYYLKTTLDKLENGEDTVIMFIGDSVTAGSLATEDNMSYVGLFSKWIAEKYPNSTVIRAKGDAVQLSNPIKKWKETVVQTGNKNTITIVNNGVSGDSMWQLYNRANNFISYNGKTPNCIFIMEGINDAHGGGESRYSAPNRFEELQESFIDYLKDETGTDIVVMTSHWAGETPDSKISDYVSAQRKIAKEKNLLLIDNKELWNKHYNFTQPNHGQGDWMTEKDTVHPTNEGHKAIFQNIVDNLYNTTIKNNNIVDLIKMDDNRINYEGSWNKVTITDNNGDASYDYIRDNSEDSKVNVKLTGNEIYAIVRDGKDTVTFDNSYDQYKSNQIKIGGSIYPKELVTVTNEDMYSAQHKRVLLHEGKNKEYDITLENIEGNLDLYGFETVTYNK